jgi:hypothetical protein
MSDRVIATVGCSSRFPFKVNDSTFVKVSFALEDSEVLIEKWPDS